MDTPDREPSDFVFDESFVRSAATTELSAAERARDAERSARAAQLRSRLNDEARTLNSQARSFRRRRWRRRAVGLAVIGGLVATGIALHRANGGKADRAGTKPFVFESDRPSPSREAKPDPLGQPAAVLDDSTRFTFIARQSDKQSPVAYDPCRPIHYVTYKRTMPPRGEQMVVDAIAASALRRGTKPESGSLPAVALRRSMGARAHRLV